METENSEMSIAERQAALWAEQCRAVITLSHSSPVRGNLKPGEVAQVAATLVQPHCQNLADYMTRNDVPFSPRIEGAVSLSATQPIS